jgi:hypothetical protein
MRNQIFCVLQKDLKEYMRTRINLRFSVTLLGLCAMVLGATCYLPDLIGKLVKMAANMISDTANLSSTLATFFPKTLKANMGVLASDIVIFYGIVVILSTYNLTSKEIKDGKWIFPMSVGYKPFSLILSKGLVYGVGAAFPSAVFYNLYYFIGSLYLSPDYIMVDAIVNSMILAFSIFSIVYITIILASIYKQAITAVITIIPLVAISPDIFALFSFGKFLPTHTLTYLYQSRNNVYEILIPTIATVVIAMILTFFAARKSSTIEVVR